MSFTRRSLTSIDATAPQHRIPHYSNLIFPNGKVDASVLCRIANNKVKNNRDGQTRSEIFRGLWLMVRLSQSILVEQAKHRVLPVHEQEARARELEIEIIQNKRLRANTDDQRRQFDREIEWRRERIAELRTGLRHAA